MYLVPLVRNKFPWKIIINTNKSQWIFFTIEPPTGQHVADPTGRWCFEIDFIFHFDSIDYQCWYQTKIKSIFLGEFDANHHRTEEPSMLDIQMTFQNCHCSQAPRQIYFLQSKSYLKTVSRKIKIRVSKAFFRCA